MAHELETGLFIGETPWHGLGNIVPADSDAARSIPLAAELSGLTWKLDKKDVFNANGEALGGFKAITRNTDGAVYAIMRDTYEPLQPSEAFEFFQPFLDADTARIETAGALRGGAIVWCLARLNSAPITVGSHLSASIGGVDQVNKYLMLTNNNDGKGSVKVGITATRVVCMNTLRAALSSSDSALLKVQHTKRMKDNLAMVRETIDAVNARFSASSELWNELAKRRVTPHCVETFVKLVDGYTDKRLENDRSKLAFEKRVQELTEILAKRNDVEPNAGTAWSLYNAENYRLNHVAGESMENRQSSLILGKAKDADERALRAALEIAKIA